jgi:hypothetical protein
VLRLEAALVEQQPERAVTLIRASLSASPKSI